MECISCIMCDRKVCKSCKKELDISAFGPSARSSTGIAHTCLVCYEINKRDGHARKRALEAERRITSKVTSGNLTCTICNQSKLFTRFIVVKRLLTGRSPECGECLAEYRRRKSLETIGTPCAGCGKILSSDEVVASNRHNCLACRSKKMRSVRIAQGKKVWHPRVVDGKRKCTDCGESKVIDDFALVHNGRGAKFEGGKIEARCKVCRRRHQREDFHNYDYITAMSDKYVTELIRRTSTRLRGKSVAPLVPIYRSLLILKRTIREKRTRT